MFTDPKNVAVITVRQIVRGGEPILHVTHDSDDGAWQFLGAGDANMDDVMLVALSEIVRLDPSVREVGDLPLGWHAWRNSPHEAWQRGRK